MNPAMTEAACYAFGLGDVILWSFVSFVAGAILILFTNSPRDVGG